MDIKNNKERIVWYPIITKTRKERRALEQLSNSGFNVYLPLIKTTRLWSDRKKIVEIPLISSHIFVRTNYKSLYNIISHDAVSRYISFNGKPAIVRDEEIEIIKKTLKSGSEVEVYEGAITEGTKVRMISGPFVNYEGKVIDFKGKNKLIIEIESLNKSLLITVEKHQLLTK